jgi:hypothetical protein
MEGPGPAVRDPAPAVDERTTLLDFLQSQRDIVSWKLDGASDDVLRSVSTPTGLTVHGLVRHLTDDERWWFRHRFAGEPELTYHWSEADRDADFRVEPDEPIADLLAEYVGECAASDHAIAGRDLAEVGADGRSSLRWVVLHMIEETARHLGHLDILREQADGSTGADPMQVKSEQEWGS